MARKIQKTFSSRSKTDIAEKPYCFVSYSTREAHVQVLIDCLKIVLGAHFEVRLTPSALESGASQQEQITSPIEDSSFCVVILDGLRPNVVFELGMMVAKSRPVILFKEAESTVDIQGLYITPPAGLSAERPPISLDTQISDIKDLYCAKWVKFDVLNTLKLVYEEYNKKRAVIRGFVEIKEVDYAGDV